MGVAQSALISVQLAEASSRKVKNSNNTKIPCKGSEMAVQSTLISVKRVETSSKGTSQKVPHLTWVSYELR